MVRTKKTSKKKMKKYNKLLVILIFFIIFFLALGLVFLKNKTPIYFSNLIKKDQTYKSSYLNIHYEPILFAEYTNESSKYYIVQDDNHMYIAYISSDLVKKIVSEDLKNNSYKISGISKNIPDDVKKLAIETYNGIVESNMIKDENFESYFGNIYLDTTQDFNNSKVCFIISALLIITFCIFYISKKRGSL